MTNATLMRPNTLSKSRSLTGDARRGVQPQQWTSSARTPLLEQRSIAAQAAYRVDDDAAIISFVLAHPQLVDLLEQAPAEIARQFPDAHLTLALHDDPEEPVTTLVIGIASSLAPREALDRLDRLDDTWWLDTQLSYRTHALITLVNRE